MSLKNPIDHWGGISQSLHWLIVALIVVMAYLGLTMVELPNTPHKVRVFALHKSIGLTILVLVGVRLAWRLYAGRPRPLPQPTWQHRIAVATHAGLYLLLFAQPLSGWAMNSAADFPLQWFGLFHVPAILPADDALHERLELVHEWLFWSLVALAVLHAAAAVWHHIFPQDATLARMLPRGWLQSSDPVAAADARDPSTEES